MAALRAQRRPQLSITGQGTVQNAVPRVPIAVPGESVPEPPRERFHAQVQADWTLYDGGRIGRQADAERARLAEDVAGVATTLYALREATTETFFSALLLKARVDALALQADDLEARLAIVQRQVEAGAMLSAEAATLEAERIQVQQRVSEAEADRRAALAVLSDLTDTPIRPDDVLALPDLDAETERALTRVAGLGVGAANVPSEAGAAVGRPAYVRLNRLADRLRSEAHVRDAQRRPSLSLFGEAGVGRPGPFDFFSNEVNEYTLGGIRLQWSIIDWGRSRREAQALRTQARAAETDAAAFARQAARDVEDDLADIARLDTAITDDMRAVALREEALRVAQRQLDEGVLLPDLYADRLTDLAQARLTLQQHRIERAQAQARLLSTLGRYPESRLLPMQASP
jgi:outer membrane protein TolC